MNPSTLILLTFFLASEPSHGSDPQEGSSIQFDVSADVTQREPVVLRYTVRNRSPGNLAVDLGYDRIANFTFVLTAPSGSRQRVRPAVRPKDHGSRTRILRLGPLEEYEQAIVLNEWLSFDQVGQYVLRVEFAGPAQEPLRLAADKSELRIRVRPRDTKALEARCQELVRSLIASKTYDERFTATVDQLSWVRDPAAVPYLEQAIAAETSPAFFDTLVAIGTPAARAAAERLTLHSRDWVATNAKGALARFKAGRSGH